MTTTLANSTAGTAAQVISTLCAVAALLVGIVVAVCAEVFIMAALANASETAIRNAKYLMSAIAIFTALCVAGSIVLMVRHSPWWATGVGIAPAVLVVVLFIIAYHLGI